MKNEKEKVQIPAEVLAMPIDDVIAKINALYHKSKAEGLTEEELAEQKIYRARYIASVRGNLTAQLEGITVERPDGSVEKLKKKDEK